jgi:hypothetical protein
VGENCSENVVGAFKMAVGDSLKKRFAAIKSSSITCEKSRRITKRIATRPTLLSHQAVMVDA